MPHDTTLRTRAQRTSLALLTLALFTMTQCVCQNRQGDTEPKGPPTKVAPAKGSGTSTTPALPKSVDTKDLDKAEKEVLASIMAEQFDPCGSPNNLLDVLKTAAPCDRAFAISAKLVQWVGEGLSKRQVVKKYLEELARTSVKAEFQFEGSPSSGDPTAKIVIVKFTDFQCPYCKLSSQPSKDLAKKYGAVIYIKHMPLSHHEHAQQAAELAMAAHQQGKFWEVYKAFFDNQEALDGTLMRSLVKKAGVDMARLDADLGSGALAAVIKRDQAEADAAKVDGTPTFFVNGFKVEFDNLEDKLKELTR